MRVIEIDGSDWQNVKDFLAALRAAIGAPDWHGWNVNAFIDSMIWGGINEIEAPYEIRILGTERASKDVTDHINLLASALAEARKWKLDYRGEDTAVSLRIASKTPK
jgi:RNAse (barnase) inhibitor barstar